MSIGRSEDQKIRKLACLGSDEATSIMTMDGFDVGSIGSSYHLIV
jgi:hypothetical protein